MGMRDFLDKLKQKAEDRLNPKPLTPEEERKQKQDNMRKQIEQLNNAVNFGKKAMKIKKDVTEKTDAIKDGLAQKTIDIVNKIEDNKPAGKKDTTPPATKKPGLIGKGVAAVKGAGNSVADKAKGIAEQQREAAARRPTTRSHLLDLIVPAVPKTDATAPKKPANDKPATKAPRTRKPKQ